MALDTWSLLVVGQSKKRGEVAQKSEDSGSAPQSQLIKVDAQSGPRLRANLHNVARPQRRREDFSEENGTAKHETYMIFHKL